MRSAQRWDFLYHMIAVVREEHSERVKLQMDTHERSSRSSGDKTAVSHSHTVKSVKDLPLSLCLQWLCVMCYRNESVCWWLCPVWRLKSQRRRETMGVLASWFGLVSLWVSGGIILFSTLPKIPCKHLLFICAACKACVLHKAVQMKFFWLMYNHSLSSVCSVKWMSSVLE